jgi:hypothetical protein
MFSPKGYVLKNSKTSPCIFKGELMPGSALIYVGIYVDDIIYFSANEDVERQFEELLSKNGTFDFIGQVSLFLGTEFTWTIDSIPSVLMSHTARDKLHLQYQS